VHIDFAVSAAGGGVGQISQGVLIAGIAQSAGVGGLDSIAGKAGEDLASGSVGVLRQYVAVAQSRAGEGHMQLLQLAVHGNGRSFHGHAVHLNPGREQDSQSVAVAGVAAVFAAIGDDENNLPPGPVA